VIKLFCEKCGTTLREGARFCPECGLVTDGAGSTPPNNEYSYETLESLFPLKAIIPILLIWLTFTAIGVVAALASGFWFVGVIVSGIVLLPILIVMWANKGKVGKWGADRTLWIITPEGYGTGYPPDVAKRIAGIGAAGALGAAKTGNPGLVYMGAGMATKTIKTVINGLSIVPWSIFTSVEYRPAKRNIVLHLPNGQVGIIKTKPDNYTYVEQLVRGYTWSEKEEK
jgi:hypothetical protein